MKAFSISVKLSLTDAMTIPLKGVNVSLGNTARIAQKAGAQMGMFSRVLGQAGTIAKGFIIGDVFMRAAGYIKDMVFSSIELASSLIEVQNVVDVTFGAMAGSINDFATTAIKKFGLSELQAKNFTGTLGSMAKASGISGDMLARMSMDLAGLAGDYASFRNLSPEEAFEKLKSVVTGETEPLRQLGMNMTVANLEAYALTQGINKQWKNMKQAEQVMLRYNYVMQTSADAQGDFSRTLQTSYANQKRVSFTVLSQQLARIAMKILPLLTTMLSSFTAVLMGIDTEAVGLALSFAFNILASTLSVIWKIISPLLKITISWIKALWNLRYLILVVAVAMTAYKLTMLAIMAIGWIKYLWMMRAIIMKAAAAQWILNTAMTLNPIALIIAGIAALIIAIILIYKNWDKVVAAFKVGFGYIKLGWYILKEAALSFLNILGLVSDETLRAAKIDVKMQRTENKKLLSDFEKAGKTASAGGAQKNQTDIGIKIKTDAGTTASVDNVKQSNGSGKLKIRSGSSSGPFVFGESAI